MIKRLGLLPVVLLALAACGGDGPVDRTVAAASVRVDAPADSVFIGQQLQLSAAALDAAGATLAGRPITWTSGSDAVATVSASGLVAGVAAGSVTITAASGGATGTVALRVKQVPVASVTVSPATQMAQFGTPVQLAATAHDAAGNTLTGRAVAWSTSDATRVQVSATGLATPVSVGEATITATVEGKSGTSRITVAPAPVASVTLTPDSVNLVSGGQAQLTLVARDAAGNALAGRVATLSTSSASVATVGANLVVTAGAEGKATLTAQVEGITARTVVVVNPAPVSTVELAPGALNLYVGAQAELALVARDAAGNVLAGRAAVLSTDNAAVATIDAGRRVTAVSPGTANITATVEGKSATTRITVVPVPVASVTLTPDSVNLVPGGQVQLTLVARDAAGNALAGRTATLSTSSASVATVGANLVVTAAAEGKATITAEVEGITARTVVVVHPAPVATVELLPGTLDLYVGGQAELALVARDAAGNVLAGRAAVLSTDNAAVATVDAGRRVTAVSPGTANVTASVEGRTATAVVRVRLVPISSLAITPDSADVFAGETLQLAVAARDSAGGLLGGRPVTLTTSSAAVATLDANQRLVAHQPGRVVVTAAAEGKTATAVFHVRNVPIATLQITPDSSQVLEGASVQLSVVARDAQGNELAGRAVTLSTSDQSIAGLSGTGLVTGTGPGTAIITAASEGKTATAKVVVVRLPVASVEISPAEVIVFAGGSQQLTAIARASDGTPLGGRAVQWSSSDPGVATVSGAGVLTGVNAGTARVTATVEGKTAQVPVTVRIPGQDVAAPEITFFDVDPAAVDVTGGPGTFTFTFRARDFGSSVSNVFVSLNHPGNTGFVPGCAGVRVSGNAYDGTYTCTITFPRNAPSNTWSVNYLSAADAVGNTMQMSNGQVAARGWPAQVTVTGAAPDTEAPTLHGFSLSPSTVNVADGPGNVEFTVTARDGSTGITGVYVSLSFPGNPGATMGCSAPQPVSGTATDGVFRCTVTFPQNSASRTWSVQYVSLTDAVGNSRQIYNGELAGNGWPTQVTVTGGNADTRAPTLTGFSFTPQTVDVSNGPGNVVFTISGEDAGGIMSVYVSLNYPNNPGATQSCSAWEPDGGTRTSGVFRCTVTFPQNSPTRTWNVEYISLTDASGNTYRPYQGELQSLGYATTVQVTN